MSTPLRGVEDEESQTKVNLLTSSTSMESVCPNEVKLKERNYMGFSDCSSVESSSISASSEGLNLRLNLKATELRLGLPGSLSPERNWSELGLMSSPKLDEKQLFPLFSPKSVVSGSKRGFSDTVEAFSEGKRLSNSEAHVMPSPRPASNLGMISHNLTDAHNTIQESNPCVSKDTNQNHSNAPKAQVVGWPPIRSSFRKNSLAATTSKNADEMDRKAGAGALFVKVSMDGAPYLRKVDLRMYSMYQEFSLALEKMFSCFTIGQYGSHGAPGKEKLSESKLKDLLHGSEYVLTYEDKDGDWMLVGDVPWEMFIGTCKRLRIMKSCDAIGLAPRTLEQSCNKNQQKIRSGVVD